MNKVLAEIIAGVIPQKMARNRYRGILRFGPLNALRLKKQLKKDTSTPINYLSICAIAKDEGPYFKEWLSWHISQGVEKFYIYDNESQDNTHEILEPYIKKGIVDYKYFPGKKNQLLAYDDCFKNHRFESRWIAFIDLDEFIVPLKDKTLKEFLKRFECFPSIEINWLVYGSSGKKQKSKEDVMQRFTFHSLPSKWVNRHVKSIVDPKRVYTMIGCHEAARITGWAVDSHMCEIKKNFREREPQQDVIRINHYAVKSYEEFQEKIARGRASGSISVLDDEYFRQYDLNDIED